MGDGAFQLTLYAHVMVLIAELLSIEFNVLIDILLNCRCSSYQCDSYHCKT